MPKTERVLRSYSKVLTFLGVLVSCFISQSNLSAQCGTMVCNNVLQISMDENCEIYFNPDLLLEGDPTTQGSSFTLTIADLGIINQALDLTETIPIGTYQYKVTNQCGNSCWGSFFAEDNIGPRLIGDATCPKSDPCRFACNEISTVLNHATFTTHLNPDFTKHCAGNLEVLFEDELIKATASCGIDTIKREWIANVDKHGTMTRMVITTQWFVFDPVDMADVWMPTESITVPCHIGEHPDSIAAFLDDPLTCEDEGIPFAYPHIEGTPMTCDECKPLEIHFKKLDEYKEDVPLLIDGQWVLIDQWTKTTDSRLVCGCDEWNQLTSEVVDIYNAVGDIVEITSAFPGMLDAEGKCKSWPTLSNFMIDPVTGSGTSLNHIPLYGNDHVCNLLTEKEDLIIPICSHAGSVSSYKVIRTWTVYDWCTATNKKSVQVIKVEDLQGPEFTIQDSVNLSTDPWLCGVNLEVPPPADVSDKCSPDHISYTVHIDGLPGLQIGGDATLGYTILDIPKGDQKLIYTVSDICGNSTQDTTVLWIKDNIPPVAIAKENIVVSLTSSGNSAGYAKVYYNSINNNSYDICSPNVKIEIRREKDLCGILGNDTYTSGRNRGDLNFGLHPDSTALVDPDGGDYIKFCCADLTEGTFGIHKVWMRVWDDANMDGVIGNDGDNFNEVWANVRVEDKLNVILTCPPDITVSCYVGLDSLSVLGTPDTRGACAVNLEYEDDLPSTHCPTGKVIRKWYADKDKDEQFDTGEKFCKQIINVRDPKPMFCSDIIFPKDTIVDCANAEMESAPIWTGNHCGLFGFSEKVDIFDLQDEYCYKIVKQFTVIDWCQYNPNSGSNAGICYGTQKITVIDNNAPTFASCEDKIVESADANCMVNDLSIRQTAIDEGDCPDKKLTWTICLDLGSNRRCDYTYSAISESGQELVVDLVDDNGDPLSMIAGTHSVTWSVTDACDNESSCTTKLIIADTKAPTPICIEALSTAVMSNNGSVEIWATDFDPNKKSFDNCDKSLTYSFSGEEIISNLMISCRPSGDAASCGDCKQTVEFPIATPIPDEVNEIVAGGEVLALSYPYNLNDPFHQQRLIDELTELGYDVSGRINQANQALEICVNYAGVAFEAVNINNGDSFSFTCTDCRGSIENGLFIENGQSQTFELPMWVWDDGYDVNCDGRITSDERNKDWCMVMLRVDDNVNVCADTESNSAAMIAGAIQTGEGQMVEAVEVVIASNHPEHPSMALTQNNGSYAFTNNPMELDYEISAARDDDYMNGVSTLDLVLIQKHILGLSILDSPYKIIASDINNDGDISARDLIELRKLILGIYAELPSNASWRFVEKAEEFQNPLSPFPFTEDIAIYDLSADMLAQDFIGVKIGDVNSNVTANSLITSEVRANSTIVLTTDQQNVSQGDRVEIEFKSEDFQSVYGMQFTMSHVGLRLVDIDEGAIGLQDEHVGIIKEDAMLSLSWGDVEAISSDQVLFTMTFEAIEDVELSKTINITSQVTHAEAYTTESYVLNDVTLQFNDSSDFHEFVLYQNEPNPFTNKTEIGFNLPAASDVTLKIFDVTGKLVLQRAGSYPKGLTIIELNSDDLSSTGILYYQLDAGKYNATKKMVMIN